MSGLLTRTGYNPVFVDSIEAGKLGAAKLPPGAVIVTAMNLHGGTARDFIDWLKTEGYGFPVIALVDNLSNADVVGIMRDGGAVDIVQRRAIDKQLVETVGRYARPEHMVLAFDKQLIPRVSEAWKEIGEKIKTIAATNANAIIFGESGTGKEQVARQIYLHSSREQKPCTVLEAGVSRACRQTRPHHRAQRNLQPHKGILPQCGGRNDNNQECASPHIRETIGAAAHSLGGTPRCEGDMHG